MNWATTITASLSFVTRVWDWLKQMPRRKLERRRKELEAESIEAQVVGDLDALRRIRYEIQDIDTQLQSLPTT